MTSDSTPPPPADRVLPADPVDAAALTDLAEKIAAEAAELLQGGHRRARATVETKSSATDMVSELDAASEALIVARLVAARPHDGLLGEEGASRAGSSGVEWIIDPLDGTTNYLYGFGAWAVSIAAEVDGVPTAGCVLDGTTGEMWSATAGRGARHNGDRLQLDPDGPPLAEALVGTGFGYTVERRTGQVAALTHVLPRVRDIRRAGSAALDLCYLAGGRLDAYFEWGIQPWDGAAGLLVAAEAGAAVGTLGGDRPGTDEVTWGARASLTEPFVALLRAAGLGPRTTGRTGGAERSGR